MKSLKAAVVVTGSLIIAGAAAPAFAQNATGVVHKSLKTADTLNRGPVQAQPLRGDVIDVTDKEMALLKTVDRTSTVLGNGTPLLGGQSKRK